MFPKLFGLHGLPSNTMLFGWSKYCTSLTGGRGFGYYHTAIALLGLAQLVIYVFGNNQRHNTSRWVRPRKTGFGLQLSNEMVSLLNKDDQLKVLLWVGQSGGGSVRHINYSCQKRRFGVAVPGNTSVGPDQKQLFISPYWKWSWPHLWNRVPRAPSSR